MILGALGRTWVVGQRGDGSQAGALVHSAQASWGPRAGGELGSLSAINPLWVAGGRPCRCWLLGPSACPDVGSVRTSREFWLGAAGAERRGQSISSSGWAGSYLLQQPSSRPLLLPFPTLLCPRIIWWVGPGPALHLPSGLGLPRHGCGCP